MMIISAFKTTAGTQSGCGNNQIMEENFDSDSSIIDPGSAGPAGSDKNERIFMSS
jgi:hypothetical protein